MSCFVSTQLKRRCFKAFERTLWNLSRNACRLIEKKHEPLVIVIIVIISWFLIVIRKKQHVVDASHNESVNWFGGRSFCAYFIFSKMTWDFLPKIVVVKCHLIPHQHLLWIIITTCMQNIIVLMGEILAEVFDSRTEEEAIFLGEVIKTRIHGRCNWNRHLLRIINNSAEIIILWIYW